MPNKTSLNHWKIDLRHNLIKWIGLGKKATNTAINKYPTHAQKCAKLNMAEHKLVSDGDKTFLRSMPTSTGWKQQ